MSDENKTKDKNIIPKYCTLGLADPNSIDDKTLTTSPSETAVEETRIWSIENKL